MSDETLSFEEHRRRRDQDPTRVRCAKCGKLIAMTATRCPECGVHFQGEAFQFTHAAERPDAGGLGNSWRVAAAIAITIALIVVALKRW